MAFLREQCGDAPGAPLDSDSPLPSDLIPVDFTPDPGDDPLRSRAANLIAASVRSPAKLAWPTFKMCLGAAQKDSTGNPLRNKKETLLGT